MAETAGVRFSGTLHGIILAFYHLCGMLLGNQMLIVFQYLSLIFLSVQEALQSSVSSSIMV